MRTKNHVVLDNDLIDRIRIFMKLALISRLMLEDFSRLKNINRLLFIVFDRESDNLLDCSVQEDDE